MVVLSIAAIVAARSLISPDSSGDVYDGTYEAGGVTYGLLTGDTNEAIVTGGDMSAADITIPATITADDGKTYFDGTEYSSGSVMTSTSYKAQLSVRDAEGKEIGGMDLNLYFTPAYKLTSAFTGSASPGLDLKKSEGKAFWKDQECDLAGLVE